MDRLEKAEKIAQDNFKRLQKIWQWGKKKKDLRDDLRFFLPGCIYDKNSCGDSDTANIQSSYKASSDAAAGWAIHSYKQWLLL